MELIRTSVGVSDIADDETTRFAEETLHKFPIIDALKLRKNFKKTLATEEVNREEFDTKILWPVPFATTMKQIYEACDGKLVRMGKELAKRFYLYTSKALSKLYCTFAPAHVSKLIRIEPLDHFIEVSSHAVKGAILHGEQAVVSRVLETNVDWAIGPLIRYFVDADRSGKQPVCQFFLSPNKDPEYGLVKIGHNEAVHINKHPEKKRNLNRHRGISWVPDINALRHVRLHARTMAGLHFLKKVFPDFVDVAFRRQVPDARCNITHAEGELHDAFQVGLERYDIGLDSAFYRIRDPSYGMELYERTVDRQKMVKLDEDKLISKITESSKIESQIVEKNNWTDLEEAIVAKENLSFPAWIGEREERRLTSYTIENMLQKIIQTVVTSEGLDLRSILGIISKEQKIIEEEFMPDLRLILEYQKGS